MSKWSQLFGIKTSGKYSIIEHANTLSSAVLQGEQQEAAKYVFIPTRFTRCEPSYITRDQSRKCMNVICFNFPHYVYKNTVEPQSNHRLMN